MEFHRIKYFLEVARWGSFSKAAEVCNISQPSLSQQVKKLEDEVGEQLILRSRDGICLSDSGTRFLPYARDIMDAVESARNFIDESRHKIKGKIKLGAIPTISPYLLPTVIQNIRRDYPDVQYEIIEETTDTLIEKLREGDIDFALLSPPTRIDQDVDYLDICDDELLVTLPLEHPLNKESILDIQALKNEKLLLLKETHCLTQQSKSFCKLSGLTPELNLKNSQMDTLLGLVELGFGFTFTPKMAVAYHPLRKVKFHSVAPEPLYRQIRLIWMSRHLPSTTQLAVISCIEKHFTK